MGQESISVCGSVIMWQRVRLCITFIPACETDSALFHLIAIWNFKLAKTDYGLSLASFLSNSFEIVISEMYIYACLCHVNAKSICLLDEITMSYPKQKFSVFSLLILSFVGSDKTVSRIGTVEWQPFWRRICEYKTVSHTNLRVSSKLLFLYSCLSNSWTAQKPSVSPCGEYTYLLNRPLSWVGRTANKKREAQGRASNAGRLRTSTWLTGSWQEIDCVALLETTTQRLLLEYASGRHVSTESSW